MLILRWCLAQKLFGSQIPVTTGGFEMRISCIWSNYLIHQAIGANRLGEFIVPKCQRFEIQTFLSLLEVVIQMIIEHNTNAICKFEVEVSQHFNF